MGRRSWRGGVNCGSEVGVEAGVSPAGLYNCGWGQPPLLHSEMIKGRPPRLDQIFQSYDPPLYFVTFCTLHRRKIENLKTAQQALEQYGADAVERFNVAIGRYVFMPDHVHLFVRGGPDFILSEWVKGLKRAISIALKAGKEKIAWQAGFFDHVLRNDESYSENGNTFVRIQREPVWCDQPMNGRIKVRLF
jgi:REP element-mobilizing transposase RayT